MTHDITVGLVGYGLRGDLAPHIHQPGGGSRVVALCDPDASARDRFRSTYGHDVSAVATLEDFLSLKPDAAFVLSPDYLHEEHACALLDAGIAVYLEKPMAITTAGADRVLAAAQRSGGRLYVGHNMRHMPFVREMKRLIDAGAIGEPKVAWCRHFVGNGGDFYFADWHAERRYGTSLLLQKGTHDIDVLHWLCQSYSTSVSAIGDRMVYSPEQGEASHSTEAAPLGETTPWWRSKTGLTRWPPRSLTGLNPAMDVEDVSMVMLRLGNGVHASYQQCHFTPDYWRNYTIIGTEGRLENFGNGGPGTVVRVWNRRHDYEPEGDLSVTVDPTSEWHGGADPLMVAEFFRYVREGGTTETSPVAARHAVAAGYAGAESIRSGGVPIQIPAADPTVTAYFE